ncbi:uncharacterized protein Z518_01532 [Rhinocladiella mackenziei CBS 650.93]|uniref:Altered inheritance of mitochondria protein 24, mitochondrial n=1 Tax=Rhinocladiella mackenziei CBS 650.93 TaxID=1442369 RepID=A0A0D2IWS5_9EURO|nr:uncharacterized protein Z518_01532 [Rhinocladiella mackenziei CBS 650.93]KIX10449.1 hypothetical protein Z518_01532 [Rhinocladiella mackenziei CBS 650.93]
MAYNPGQYNPQQQQQQQYGSNVPYGGKGQHQPHGPLAASSWDNNSWTPTVDGISYSITNRDTNTLLNVRIPQGSVIKSKPGAMIQMSPSITLQGKVKFSMKKMFTGGEMAESIYTGPGEVSLAPTLFGDITTIPINSSEGWTMGKDAFLACTNGVVKETKSQGLGKALFSGEDLFVYHVSGHGILWVTSFGAIVVREVCRSTTPIGPKRAFADRWIVQLQHNEQHIVDNGHLVAWNCRYAIEKAGKSGMHSITTGEGAVCRFTGPGRIYIQTRNLDEFGEWCAAQAPRGA